MRRARPLPDGRGSATLANRAATEGRGLSLYYASLSKSGKLIPTDEVKVVWFKQARQIRDKLLAVPAKLAPQVAAVSEVRAVRELLAKHI